MALEYDRERVHQIIRESQPWYRNPGTIKLYLLLLSRKSSLSVLA